MHAASSADDEGVTATIVDTVSGRVLHQQHHRSACGPVAATFFDNQAMLQFWDMRAFRWHFSVMELYEHGNPIPPTPKLISSVQQLCSATCSPASLCLVLSMPSPCSTKLSMFSPSCSGLCCVCGCSNNTLHPMSQQHAGALTGAMAAERNATAHLPVTLEVLKQSFFGRVGVRAMAPTATRHSVTPKHILMATNHDQVRNCLVLDITIWAATRAQQDARNACSDCSLKPLLCPMPALTKKWFRGQASINMHAILTASWTVI